LTHVLTAQDKDVLYGLCSTPLVENDPDDIDFLLTSIGNGISVEQRQGGSGMMNLQARLFDLI